MKVVLLQNVPELGQKDDTKNVKPGYWRNFLLPQKLAVAATNALIKQAEKRKEEQLKQKELKEKELTVGLEKINGKKLIIKAKADDKGSLFAGIDAEKITEAIKEKWETEILQKDIQLEKPVKQTGLHEITIKNAVLKLDVKPEH